MASQRSTLRQMTVTSVCPRFRSRSWRRVWGTVDHWELNRTSQICTTVSGWVKITYVACVITTNRTMEVLLVIVVKKLKSAINPTFPSHKELSIISQDLTGEEGGWSLRSYCGIVDVHISIFLSISRPCCLKSRDWKFIHDLGSSSWQNNTTTRII